MLASSSHQPSKIIVIADDLSGAAELAGIAFVYGLSAEVQREFESASDKESARKKIVSAAKRHGIEIGEDDKILQPASGLRAATTKRGPRGGRKTVAPKRRTTRRQTTAARRNIKKAVAARHRRSR